MAIAPIPHDRASARIAPVEQHIRLENAHDLEAVLRTFGPSARYDDEPWAEHYQGPDGVRRFYEQLMQALPDLQIDVQRRHVTDDAILVEVIIRGTHLGGWRGLPPTGRRIEFPLCGIYTFDSNDRLAGEKIYYDPRHGVAPTRRLPRTAEPARANHHPGDAPDHHGPRPGKKADESLTSRCPEKRGREKRVPYPCRVLRDRVGILTLVSAHNLQW